MAEIDVKNVGYFCWLCNMK